MRMPRARALILGLPAAAVIVLLASCASAPKRSTTEWMGVLPGDATMYVSISVPQSAQVIRKTLTDSGPDYKDVIQLADRTRRLVAAITLTKGSPVRFSAVALGDYPAFLIGLGLGGNKAWKQVSVPDGSYFLWNKADLQLSVPVNDVLMTANGQMESLLRRYKAPVPLPLPPEVAADMEKTDVVLYMPQLPGGIGQDAVEQPVVEETDGRPRLPIREVWIDAMKTQTGYMIAATMNTPSEQKARVLALLLRVGIIAWMKGQDVPDSTERLRAITVLPDGTQVRVKGIAVSDVEIIPLFLSLINGPAAPEQAK